MFSKLYENPLGLDRVEESRLDHAQDVLKGEFQRVESNPCHDHHNSPAEIQELKRSITM